MKFKRFLQVAFLTIFGTAQVAQLGFPYKNFFKTQYDCMAQTLMPTLARRTLPSYLEHIVAQADQYPITEQSINFYNSKSKSNNKTKLNNQQEIIDFILNGDYDIVEIKELNNKTPSAILFRDIDGNVTHLFYDLESSNFLPDSEFDKANCYPSWDARYILVASNHVLKSRYKAQTQE